jgi:hypothetical protein
MWRNHARWFPLSVYALEKCLSIPFHPLRPERLGIWQPPQPDPRLVLLIQVFEEWGFQQNIVSSCPSQGLSKRALQSSQNRIISCCESFKPRKAIASWIVSKASIWIGTLLGSNFMVATKIWIPRLLVRRTRAPIARPASAALSSLTMA